MVYGSMVWVTATLNGRAMKKLEKAQRVALLSIFGVMGSTPIMAMETLIGISPIRVYIQEVAVHTMCRLRRRGQWLSWGRMGVLATQTHIQTCEAIGGIIPETGYPCDFRKDYFPELSKFRRVIRTRDQWMEQGYPDVDPLELICHTDGSKLDGLAGAAFYYSGPGGVGKFPLGEYASVFQAEVIGIIEAIASIDEHDSDGSEGVNFFVDCMGALQALDSDTPVVELVRECFGALNRLAERREVTLYWVPAHRGYEGNERVDVLAKEATKVAFCGPLPIIPLSVTAVRTAIRQWALIQHTKQWKLSATCIQTKRVVEVPSGETWRYLRSLGRQALRLVTQVITGHNTLNKHLFAMGTVSSPTCTMCGVGEETSYHYIGECERYASVRQSVLGSGFLGQEDIKNIPLPALLKFIKVSGRFHDDQRGDGRSAQ
jgi:ribonuclease HI